MRELTVTFSDAEWDALTDLADALGSTPEDVARECVPAHLREDGRPLRADV